MAGRLLWLWDWLGWGLGLDGVVVGADAGREWEQSGKKVSPQRRYKGFGELGLLLERRISRML